MQSGHFMFSHGQCMNHFISSLNCSCELEYFEFDGEAASKSLRYLTDRKID